MLKVGSVVDLSVMLWLTILDRITNLLFQKEPTVSEENFSHGDHADHKDFLRLLQILKFVTHSF